QAGAGPGLQAARLQHARREGHGRDADQGGAASVRDRDGGARLPRDPGRQTGRNANPRRHCRLCPRAKGRRHNAALARPARSPADRRLPTGQALAPPQSGRSSIAQYKRNTALLFCSAALLVLPLSETRAQSAPATPSSPSSQRSYVPADFARFAPKTAYDMLRQVPGFTIRTADEERGLGQASENVLINGQRITNKSGGATDELRRVPAGDVERIEIVEAAGLGIAGLAGQVANVIVKAERKASGQFEWAPNWRAHFTKPQWFGGSISYTGKTGPVDFTLSLANDWGRGGFGGPIDIFNAAGVRTELREETFQSEYEHPILKGKFGLDGPGSSVGNLSLAY